MARFVSISFLLAVVAAMAATTFLPARAAELTIDILPHAALDAVEDVVVVIRGGAPSGRFPVEQTKSAILLVSGGSDLIQPSERMGRMIVESMVDAGLGDQVRHVVYPDAGAMLSGDGVLPTGPGVPRFGGSAQGIATAQFYGWREVLDFLEAHLR